jgi:tryptophanyl-tRNA synthetase
MIEEQMEKISIVNEDIITPWNVQGVNNDGIDYEKLIDKLGATRLSDEIIAKLEKVVGKPAHYLIKRGIFVSHRDLDRILDLHAANKPFYINTGISPSESMHLGHFLPFIITK